MFSWPLRQATRRAAPGKSKPTPWTPSPAHCAWAARTVSSGGTAPVAMADHLRTTANLYVANQGNNSVVHFTIAGNGVLTQKDSITLAAAPISICGELRQYLSLRGFGTTQQPLRHAHRVCAQFRHHRLAVTATDALSRFRRHTTTTRFVPTGVTVLANSDAVYVCAYDKSAYNPGGTTTSNANPGWLFGYAVGSGGALTAFRAAPTRPASSPRPSPPTPPADSSMSPTSPPTS